MACPHCRKNAPLVYRGVAAYCSACNRPRAPFSAKAVNFAGRPSKLGGTLGTVAGSLTLIFGVLLAVAIMLFFQFAFPTATIGYAIGLPVLLFSIVIGLLLLFGSRRLVRSGEQAARSAQLEALRAIAENRGGTLTALDASRALGMGLAETEALLNDYCKTDPDSVSLEFDEEGRLFYLFKEPGRSAPAFGVRYRVEPEGRVREEDLLGDHADEPARRRERR